MSGASSKVLKYQAPSGFSVEIEAVFCPEFNKVGCSWTFSTVKIENDRRIRSVLREAYRQGPKGPESFLAVIVDNLEFPLSHFSISNALFGTLYSTWTVGQSTVTDYRDLGGIFSPAKRTRLSAIGFYRFKLSWLNEEDRDLKIYHNPWASHALAREVLAADWIKHFVQNDNKAEFIQR